MPIGCRRRAVAAESTRDRVARCLCSSGERPLLIERLDRRSLCARHALLSVSLFNFASIAFAPRFTISTLKGRHVASYG